MATKPTTVTELWKSLDQEWTKITPEQCENLVMSCGRRCAEVIKSKGLYTSYYILTAVEYQDKNTYSCVLNNPISNQTTHLDINTLCHTCAVSVSLIVLISAGSLMIVAGFGIFWICRKCRKIDREVETCSEEITYAETTFYKRNAQKTEEDDSMPALIPPNSECLPLSLLVPPGLPLLPPLLESPHYSAQSPLPPISLSAPPLRCRSTSGLLPPGESGSLAPPPATDPVAPPPATDPVALPRLIALTSLPLLLPHSLCSTRYRSVRECFSRPAPR
ncbi:unnamed protein product [Leuciscus chuanchicus]